MAPRACGTYYTRRMLHVFLVLKKHLREAVIPLPRIQVQATLLEDSCLNSICNQENTLK